MAEGNNSEGGSGGGFLGKLEELSPILMMGQALGGGQGGGLLPLPLLIGGLGGLLANEFFNKDKDSADGQTAKEQPQNQEQQAQAITGTATAPSIAPGAQPPIPMAGSNPNAALLQQMGMA